MGWWSKCIMGGDAPYDVAANAEDLIKGMSGYSKLPREAENSDGMWGKMHMPSEWTDQERSVLKDILTEYTPEAFILNSLLFDSDGDPDLGYNEIAGPVIGLILLSSGVAITDEVKISLIMACHNDSWSKQDEERKAIMDSFGLVIKDYDGTPPKITQESLFMKIEKTS